MSDEPLSAEEIRTLRSIMRGLSAAEWRALKAIASGIVGAMGGAVAQASSSGGSGGRVAADHELDGQYSDPTVRKDPKRWAGASYAGARYSQCPSDYLIELASFLDWSADKDAQKPDPKRHRNGTPYYEFDRQNARLARGWARRNQGKAMPPPAPVTSDANNDEYTGAAEVVQDAGEWVP